MPEKASELAKFQAGLSKTFGERVASPGSSRAIISTGSLTLDRALRRGGWDQGFIHELLGPPDSGKSTVIIRSLAQHQEMFPGRSVAYVDMEGTFSYDWAEANGLDTSEEMFLHLYPDHSEDASDMARKCCRSGLYSCVAIDSVGGMESKKAFEDKKGEIKDAEDELPGRNAQVISRMVKHLASLARRSKTTILVVNQPRVVIGSSFPMTKPAGPGVLQHATATQVDMRRIGSPLKIKVGDEEEAVAFQTKAQVKRSKIVAPGGVAEFWINNRDTEEYGPAGINVTDEYVVLGLSTGMISQKSGGWYQVLDAPQVQTRPAVTALLRDNDELTARLRAAILGSVSGDGGQDEDGGSS